MFADSFGFENLVAGSHVVFKERALQLTQAEREVKIDNARKLYAGVEVLRRFRNEALSEQGSNRQKVLSEAHKFSEYMAGTILDLSLPEKPISCSPQVLKNIQDVQGRLQNKNASSYHSNPPSTVVHNLFRATEDMLVRIEEKAGSVVSPDHKLSADELKYVLVEFLSGTNMLPRDAIGKFFNKSSKIGGILSGGSVYLEIVKKVVEKYGNGFTIKTFVIAVDKEKKVVAYEQGSNDDKVADVILTDDMIDRGGTMTTALQNAGGTFQNATIYSGNGRELPGEFQKRQTQKRMGHLTILFQDYADLSMAGKYVDADRIFEQANSYAKDNGVELQPGWYIRKAKIDELRKRK
ncbi:MAG: phosphoribosyltransferase [Candidatus Woesebacteria bacterium]|nr:MAG: phosphoribosyltransferase [Candidatus Woesebacteria bacterium]